MDQVSLMATLVLFTRLNLQQTDFQRLQIDSDLAMDPEYNEKGAEHEDVAIITPDESMDDATLDDALRADDHEAMKKALMSDLTDVEIDEETMSIWTIEGWRTELGVREHGPVF